LAGCFLKQIRIDCRESDSLIGMTSYFQDGGHDVISCKSLRLFFNFKLDYRIGQKLGLINSQAASAGCPPSACDVSSWSMVHSYLFFELC